MMGEKGDRPLPYHDERHGKASIENAPILAVRNRKREGDRLPSSLNSPLKSMLYSGCPIGLGGVLHEQKYGLEICPRRDKRSPFCYYNVVVDVLKML
jgi:hypothetical protein